MVKSLASASSATRAYSIFKVRSFNLLGLSTQPARRDSNPHEAIANWLQYLLGGTMYSISITDQIFCFKVFRFFLTPLTFQHLYYITSFSICQALFLTFFYFFLSNQSSLKPISIDVLDYPTCITHHYQEDFSLNQHTYYNSSIPLCQPFF